jgi:L-alanine-DL-glutamate epimerase-like enolase superfamily enzyme
MEIESVDVFYLALPEIRPIGDGSQDMLLVRVRAGGYTGWGDCEASPVTSIASLVCPMSHGACRPVLDSVLGERLDGPADIRRIVEAVRANSLDLLQADHTLSGIEVALWDLLGHRCEQPVYELLGDLRAEPKTPYASLLFGDTPQETLDKARRIRAEGYRAAKFGWGPYGTTTPEADADLVHAAREGLGDDGVLMVDAGTVWKENVEAAAARLPALEDVRALWLEEPFVTGALRSYSALAARSGGVRLAACEGAHNPYMAEHLIDHGGIAFAQIDAGRIGGIASARRVAEYAHSRGLQFVNHTFTSHLALSASLQPFAGSKDDWLCEYPVELSPLSRDVTANAILPDADGLVSAPSAPGLGMRIDVEAARPYLVDVELAVGGTVLYRTPDLSD